jgi:hypothetical protein
VRNRTIAILAVAAISMAGAGCASNDNGNANVTTTTETTTVNANATAAITPPSEVAPAASTETTGDSIVETTTSSSGVKTETRTFKNNARVSKVVVTTDKSGKKTARVYSSTGESRELPENKVAGALSETGDALADSAGFVADKSKDAYHATKEGTGKVVDKTASGAKTVGEKTANVSKTVGEETVEGAKTVGEKTAEGAKKAAKAVKNAVTP